MANKPTSWEIVDARVNEIKKLSKEAQVDLDNFIRRFDRINKLCKEAYLTSPKRDRLQIGDCGDGLQPWFVDEDYRR